jgi:hypothetical protein
MARQIICDVPKFKRKQKVVAVGEIPGVPVGTAGKVYYEAGVTWFRYHVAFENGIELSNVDGNDLDTVEGWEERQRAERRARREAEREAQAAEAAKGPHIAVNVPASH